MNMKLNELVEKFDTPKGAGSHNYIRYYEKYLEDIRDDVTKILEIGIGRVHNAASLKMWKEYFPNAKIIGMDVNEFNLNLDNVHTFRGDQADRKKLKELIKEYGGEFDLIIDDGGHWTYQQQVSLGFLFKYLKTGGFYFIEDIIAPYMPVYSYEFDDNQKCILLDTPKSVRNVIKLPYEIMQILSYGNLSKDGYGNPIIKIGKYGVFPDESNSTSNVIINYFESPYMTQEEIQYLQENVYAFEFSTSSGIEVKDISGNEEKVNVLAILEKQ